MPAASRPPAPAASPAGTVDASPPARPAVVLLSPSATQRALDHLARAIARAHPDPEELVLVGIQTGGVQVAQLLAARLARQWPGRVSVGQLDIAMHRDDLDRRLAPPVHPTTVPEDIAGKVVVLLHDLGRPRAVRLAVLVERPHRELPIRPDFVGKTVRTAPQDRVEVEVNPANGVCRVLLYRGA
jgi:pyrimidine operon attenuation protein/uracil phosphoribosyltransferase